MIIKNEIPILEYDDASTEVIAPNHDCEELKLPEKCLFAFLGDAISGRVWRMLRSSIIGDTRRNAAKYQLKTKYIKQVLIYCGINTIIFTNERHHSKRRGDLIYEEL